MYVCTNCVLNALNTLMQAGLHPDASPDGNGIMCSDKQVVERQKKYVLVMVLPVVWCIIVYMDASILLLLLISRNTKHSVP